jgi:DNA-binding GntR family transcriptional regulator
MRGRSIAHLTRPPSVFEYVCGVLREDILSGDLSPGSRITEAFIMAHTGASRTPVREALRRLEAEGLVSAHPRRGTFVTYRLSAEEALRIYDVRLVLEPYLTSLAAQRMRADALEWIRGVFARFEAAIDAIEPQEAGHLDAEFHLGIYEVSGSELLNVLRGYWSQLQLQLSERVYTTELPRRFVQEHRGILAALERCDGELASDRMRAHIEHSRKTMVRSLHDGPSSPSGRAMFRAERKA